MTNYTSAHESLLEQIGEARLDFPPNHVEADNRLAWFLGRLDEKYGDDAFYVHLIRAREGTATSYRRRWKTPKGIIRAYRRGILRWDEEEVADDEKLALCEDYYETVNANIRLFLKDKTKQIVFELENAQNDFRKFWHAIGAEGDLEAGVAEWSRNYDIGKKAGGPKQSRRILRKAKRIAEKLPGFVKDA